MVKVFNPYLNVIIFSTPQLIRNLWQLKTVVFLHWCLIRAVPLKSIKMLNISVDRTATVA